MKLKWNWGTGIGLFYGLFMVVLLALVFRSTQIDHSLVAEDYYALDLNYQEHYDKLSNTMALDQDLSITREDDRLVMAFPGDLGQVSGEVHFFCPSNSSRDFQMPISTNAEMVQTVPVGNLASGMWRVKVDWQAGGKAFFKEKIIHL